jgi:hypothetical protein
MQHITQTKEKKEVWNSHHILVDDLERIFYHTQTSAQALAMLVIEAIQLHHLAWETGAV